METIIEKIDEKNRKPKKADNRGPLNLSQMPIQISTIYLISLLLLLLVALARRDAAGGWGAACIL